MTSALVFALSMTGFGLLVFGERMGLGTDLAARGVLLVICLGALALSLINMTSRLGRFMVGSRSGAALGLFAISSGMFLAGLQVDPGLQRGELSPWQLAVFALGFVLVPALSPFNPWRNFALTTEEAGRDPDASVETRGALGVMMLIAALATALGLFWLLPQVVARLSPLIGIEPGRLAGVIIALITLLALLGGMAALARAAVVLALMAMLFVAMPYGAFLSRQGAELADSETLRRLIVGASAFRAERPDAPALMALCPAFVAGLISGASLHQPATMVGSRGARAVAILGGAALALALFLAARAGEAMLREIMGLQLLSAPPSQWPVFVFDESLRGWLTVCGVAPEDASAAARACQTGHPRNPLPYSAFRFDQALAAPALALSFGWPVILGLIWGLILPLVTLSAAAFALHSAASGFSERVLFRWLRPRALRSGRLALARLALIGLAAALFWAESQSLRPDAAVARWFMLGAALSLGAAMIAGWIIRAIRGVRAWRERRASPAPAAAPEPI